MGALITTEDNPFDPSADYLSWYAWDVYHGYNTCSYLARVASISDDMPEVVIDSQIEAAIDEIIIIHAGGMYKKIITDD